VIGLDDGVLSLASAFDHTCAVMSDVAALCWGANSFGQLGDGSNEDTSLPRAVAGLTNIVAVGLGAVHTCAGSSDRAVFCWGNNGANQLGSGTEDSSLPLQVVGLQEKPTPTAAQPSATNQPTPTASPDRPQQLPRAGSADVRGESVVAFGLVLAIAGFAGVAGGLFARFRVDS
jgi:hypothetical protein